MITKFNPIDVHVGGRARLRRMELGLSQEKLGERLGVTFQQIQKYEKGANRIGASRLYAISVILEVSVQYFFDELTPVLSKDASGQSLSSGHHLAADFVASPEGLALNIAFSRIKDQKTRKHLSELVKSVADQIQN